MVRLTAELIEQCAQYTNPVRDRELDLRGKIVFQHLSSNNTIRTYRITKLQEHTPWFGWYILNWYILNWQWLVTFSLTDF